MYNSTQGVIERTLKNDSTAIEIRPAAPNEPDVWPENGFASLPGELVYYDAVERNGDGKVVKLLRCLRGYQGEPQDYAKGTPIYGNVVAEHHNQLAEAIATIEKTIGDLVDSMTVAEGAPKSIAEVDAQFALNMATSLTTILNSAPVFDDACPDVEFMFNMISSTQWEFCVRILGPYKSYRLDFGDGSYTTTQFSGTHTYASSGDVNPYVTVTSDKCCVVQQPNETFSNNNPFPAEEAPNPLVVTIPEVPDFPNFVAPRAVCPGPLFNMPPLIVPNACLDCSDGPPVSSVSRISDICTVLVSLVGCCIPSQISVVGCCPPSKISIVGCCPPSLISLVGCCNLISQISIVGCCPPSRISIVGNCLPSKIDIVGCCPPSQISIVGCCPPSRISIVGCCPPSVISIVGCCPPSVISIVGCCPPSVISIVGCCPPSVISIVGCCPPSVISLVGCYNLISRISIVGCCPPSVISLVGCCPPSVISFVNPPSFSPIQFGQAPNFIPIQFGQAPSFIPIQFGQAPNFIPIQFGQAPSFIPIQFDQAPGFSTIQFGQAPSVTVNWGTPPTVNCIVTVQCSSTPAVTPMVGAAFADMEDSGIPFTFDDIGIPSEIRIIAPKLSDIRLAHDLPQYIELKASPLPDIKIVGPDKPLPKKIQVVHDIPREIHLVADGLPASIKLDASDVPASIMVVPAPDFPSLLRLEAVGIPDSIQVTGFPAAIEIVHDIPSAIRLEMPENPVVRLEYTGGPIPMSVPENLHLEIARALSEIIIAQPGR